MTDEYDELVDADAADDYDGEDLDPGAGARYLQRRRDVREQLALVVGLSGKELAEQRKCVRWSRLEEALEITLSPAARRLAREQAGAGDAQALEALERTGQLDPAVVSEVRAIEATPRESPSPVATADPVLLRSIRRELHWHRGRGESFDTAWAATVGCIPPSKGAAGVWLQALEATRSSWQRAYQGDGDQVAEQVASLLSGLDATDDAHAMAAA